MSVRTLNLFCTEPNNGGICQSITIDHNSRISYMSSLDMIIGQLYNKTIRSIFGFPGNGYQEIYIFHDVPYAATYRIDAHREFQGSFTRIDLARDGFSKRIELNQSWLDGATSIYNIITRETNEVRIPTRALTGIVLRFFLDFFVKDIPGGFLSVGSNQLIDGPQFRWYPHPLAGNQHNLFPEFQYLSISQKFDIRTAFFAGKKIEITLFIRIYEDQGRLRLVYDNYHFSGERGFAYDEVRNAVRNFLEGEKGTINSFFNLITTLLPTTISGVYLLPGYQLRNRIERGHNTSFEYFDRYDNEVTIVIENPASSDIPILNSVAKVFSEYEIWKLKN